MLKCVLSFSYQRRAAVSERPVRFRARIVRLDPRSGFWPRLGSSHLQQNHGLGAESRPLRGLQQWVIHTHGFLFSSQTKPLNSSQNALRHAHVTWFFLSAPLCSPHASCMKSRAGKRDERSACSLSVPRKDSGSSSISVPWHMAIRSAHEEQSAAVKTEIICHCLIDSREAQQIANP